MASSSNPHTNRLAQEKSPYLLQHAHNPVDWYPWGDEAIQKAKTEKKLIFLSVGYSTCHWCHVMEKESFENNDVAEIMNSHFVNIKVDREERPDIDKIYMNFLLLINGSGGWPMSVWLTPDLAPITAGTYFPPNDNWGMPGFKKVLLQISNKWRDDKDNLARTGNAIIEAMRKSVAEKDTTEQDIVTVEGKFNQAVTIYKRNFDKVWGGFGQQPKFPEVSKLNFMLHAHAHQPESRVLELVLDTLKKIAQGGIHDHVFGGFARYSVDRQWHVPHFEKMLYDQGQLLMVYSNAYKMKQDEYYLDVADDIFRYICKDLHHPGGGFYSGEDADSYPNFGDKDKIEGAFYAWTWTEIKDLLQENSSSFSVKNAFDIYSYYYGVTESGNVEPSSDPHGHLKGKNILMVRTTFELTANKFKTDVLTVKDLLKNANNILHEVREKRPRPHLDTKIITAWNGLVLSGLSKLASIKNAPNQKDYLRVAKELVEFIKKKLYIPETKTLLRSCYGEGTNSDVATVLIEPIAGFLDDYAFLIKGLLDYYATTMDLDALKWARDLQDTQDRLFWDKKNFAYFYSQENASNVIIRLKEDHDGAEPCGNSVAGSNLQLLSAYFEDKKYKEKATKLFDFFSNSNPFGYVLPEMMSSLLLHDKGLTMLVLTGPTDNTSECFIEIARNYFIPGLLIIHNRTDDPENVTRKSIAQFKMVNDRPTVYLCHNQVCQLPITTAQQLTNSLSVKYIFK